jgi:hypothetical protein
LLLDDSSISISLAVTCEVWLNYLSIFKEAFCLFFYYSIN